MKYILHSIGLIAVTAIKWLAATALSLAVVFLLFAGANIPGHYLLAGWLTITAAVWLWMGLTGKD